MTILSTNGVTHSSVKMCGNTQQPTTHQQLNSEDNLMQDMRDLHRQGLIADDYMDGLEQSMKHAKTLDHFEAHLERVSGKPDNDFRGSGGNKKGHYR